jgi:hypothetical protein
MQRTFLLAFVVFPFVLLSLVPAAAALVFAALAARGCLGSATSSVSAFRFGGI